MCPCSRSDNPTSTITSTACACCAWAKHMRIISSMDLQPRRRETRINPSSRAYAACRALDCSDLNVPMQGNYSHEERVRVHKWVFRVLRRLVVPSTIDERSEFACFEASSHPSLVWMHSATNVPQSGVAFYLRLLLTACGLTADRVCGLISGGARFTCPSAVFTGGIAANALLTEAALLQPNA